MIKRLKSKLKRGKLPHDVDECYFMQGIQSAEKPVLAGPSTRTMTVGQVRKVVQEQGCFLEQIFNLNTFCLFWKSIPSRTFIYCSLKIHGVSLLLLTH